MQFKNTVKLGNKELFGQVETNVRPDQAYYATGCFVAFLGDFVNTEMRLKAKLTRNFSVVQI